VAGRRATGGSHHDHGVLYGAVDFYKAATEAGVKPIIGMEGYLTPGSRFDRAPRRRTALPHHPAGGDDTGYRNLVKLASRAFLEGFYYKPRIDRELLAEHSPG